MYSKSINNLIKALSKLPSVGQRTAERYVFHLLGSGKKEVGELTLALKNLVDNVKSCETCWDFADTNPCDICQDKTRDNTVVCVVSESQDIPALEKTGEYKGLYFVLRGTIGVDGVDDLENTKITKLLDRVKTDQSVREIILALNPDLPGETTMMYLQKETKKIKPNIKLTRLARGLPMGSDLQYADEITLGSALKNRLENNT